MTAPHPTEHEPQTHVHTLPNGVRVLTLRLPQLRSVQVSVFVRAGSQHEGARQHGISHLVEHMAFKGTHTRDCQRINLDAERLGAEVNAHTDKDHSAFHMVGHVRDTGRFLRMLGDIVLHSSFPPDELERERQVILHEFSEDEDDPMSCAFRLFDKACYGTHPAARSVIGTRRSISGFTRDDVLAYVRSRYTGANLVVGVAGDVDATQVARQARAAFGALPEGTENRVPAPEFIGGLRSRRLPGCTQTHLVLGFPIPALGGAHHASVLAAALLGEGMSSPLMDQLRERRALVYYAACSADVMALCGQFVIEASTSAENVDEFFVQVMRLLREHALAIDTVALQRARNQIAMRGLRLQERPARHLEAAALDLFCLGRVRTRAELAAASGAVRPAQLREVFARMRATLPAIAMTGRLRAGLNERVLEITAPGVA
ncbi:MAG TPA: pitrilysin family protein [Rubrivivax sp.]|nr:pitrilysin family protein [Rubrivivax sp.]